MNKLIKRTITGVIYVALLIAAILGGPVLFATIFCCILAFGILELERLCMKDKPQPAIIRIVDIAGGLAMFLSTFFSYKCQAWINPIVCYLPYFVIRMVMQLYIKNADTLKSATTSAFSQIYIALPITLLNLIYFEYGNPQLLLVCFAFIWMNDTGAFCIGSLIGKRRLFERISPKKSWEGFFGGILFNIVLALVLYCSFNDIFADFALYEWVLFSIIVSIFATWGDLAESLIKRSVSAKDSGTILPGHGGVLDRIDSLLLVAPASLIIFYIIL